MGGGKDSGGSNVNVAPSAYENEMARIASEMFNTISNLRKGFLSDYENILGVGSGAGTTGKTTTTTTGAGTGTGIGYIPGANGIWNKYTADPKGYFSDTAGNLYPGSSVITMPTGTGSGFGNFNQTGQVHYILDDQGQTIFLQPSTNSPLSGIGTGTTTTTATGTTGGARYDPTKLPTYEPLFGLQKQSLESQYQQAKRNIMASTPTGGNLTGALSGLEMNRAASMGAMPAELSSGILSDMLNKAYGVAFQSPQTSLSGLSSASGTYGNRQAAAMAQSAQDTQSSYGLLGGLGQGVGKAIGAAGGK